MIDLSSEKVISLTDATKLFPRRGNRAKRPHVATLYRWIDRGVRGIRLESIRVGGSTCTSVEAIQRFCNRLTQGDPDAAVHYSTRREQEIQAAEAALAAAGI